MKKPDEILDEKCGNFHNVLNFFENFMNSKIKVRTQIFPKMDKK